MYGPMFCHHGPAAQDFNQEAKISDQLLAHFNQTWEDRQIYYMARERAKVQKDLMTVIIDSYDHAKMSLPKYPMARTPKRTVYEATRRDLFAVNLTNYFMHLECLKYVAFILHTLDCYTTKVRF